MGVRLSAAAWAAVIFGALLVVIAAAFLGPASTLQTKMTQRFQEVDAQARTQREALAAEQRRAEEARLAAERRAQEEEARRRAQIETDARQRQAQEQAQREEVDRRFATLSSEWRAITRRQSMAVNQLLAQVEGAERAIVQAAASPEPQRATGLRPEDYESRRPCNDPLRDGQLWGTPSERRARNIIACAHYLTLFPKAETERMRVLMVALMQRVRDPSGPTYARYPFQTIIAFVWLRPILAQAEHGGVLPSLPPLLNADNQLNHQLVHELLPPGFTERLMSSATPAEEAALRREVYPDLQRLVRLLSDIRDVCRATRRSDCFRVD